MSEREHAPQPHPWALPHRWPLQKPPSGQQHPHMGMHAHWRLTWTACVHTPSLMPPTPWSWNPHTYLYTTHAFVPLAHMCS